MNRYNWFSSVGPNMLYEGQFRQSEGPEVGYILWVVGRKLNYLALKEKRKFS